MATPSANARLWDAAETILLKGATVVDPAAGLEEPQDIFIRRGKIEGLSPSIAREADLTVDLSGLACAPGFGDLHVHFREPGNEESETIETGSHAAAVGGFTRVACMPNTKPAIDTRADVEYVFRRAQAAGYCRVFPIGAGTRGREGEALAEMREMQLAGAVAVSDDGAPVAKASVMRRLLEYAGTWDLLVISHSEDPHLSAGGVMNEGYWSTVLGLPGNPAASEGIAISRDVRLCELTGARLHVAHVSTAEGVDTIRRAKNRGVRVTAETAPHYISLTDGALRTFDPVFRVAPPLRTEEDRRAVIEGLKDGTLDLIATDHAPHAKDHKDKELDQAPPGMIGLETSLGVGLEYLHHREGMSLTDVVRLYATRVAEIAGWGGGRIQMGEDVDLTVFDPRGEWVVDPDQFVSRSRNCPFKGWKLRGRVKMTVCAGRLTHERGVRFQASERLQSQSF